MMMTVARPIAEARAPEPKLEDVDLANRVRVLPGETRSVVHEDYILMTVLGSCVSACIRDPRTGFGGMNHFMLPESETGEWNGEEAALRYGNYAMEALINEILKTGCRREDLEIKVFGGANLGFHNASVGEKNSDFVLGYLEAEGLHLTAFDLGGNHGRRLFYKPSTGVVRQFYIRTDQHRKVARQERDYAKALVSNAPSGSVELF
ncbi:chemoreceptor glutamine deamidase CheD [Roseibium limicola]|uniref:Probable chemoreceptor glutamine deamidase CheD n=1 Tax=Roseibium limicola TaxID=2816037 RepID=A0A939EPH3_9HYPH|nr:chemoreceptor glutamine deamidase CheD [Roseibium limicola]MBO0346540.1 chemoreceptor glutamine deamidase CheD [Roseibium limicola]